MIYIEATKNEKTLLTLLADVTERKKTTKRLFTLPSLNVYAKFTAADNLHLCPVSELCRNGKSPSFALLSSSAGFFLTLQSHKQRSKNAVSMGRLSPHTIPPTSPNPPDGENFLWALV